MVGIGKKEKKSCPDTYIQHAAATFAVYICMLFGVGSRAGWVAYIRGRVKGRDGMGLG